MRSKALIVAYAIVDLVFIAIIIAGVRKGVRIQRLLPAIIVVTLSNSLWLMFALRRQR
jgi:hypothetical protein